MQHVLTVPCFFTGSTFADLLVHKLIIKMSLSGFERRQAFLSLA